MKFRATLRIENLHYLIGAAAAIQRLGKASNGGSKTFLVFTPNRLFFNNRNGLGGIEFYTEFNMEDVFVLGWILQSKRNDIIALSIDSERFYNTLKLGANSSRIQLRLAKREDQGVLSFEFTDSELFDLVVTQDCVIQPLQGEAIDASVTPLLPRCQSNVELPSLKLFLNAIERLQKIGAHDVILSGQASDGKSEFVNLTLEMSAELVQGKAAFMQYNRLLDDETENKDEFPSFSRSIPTRTMTAGIKAIIAACQNRYPEGVVACLVPSDPETRPWICLVFQSMKLHNLHILCVLPISSNSDVNN